MSSCSIPITTACSAGVGLTRRRTAKGEETCPAMNLQVNISIPVKELLDALSVFSKDNASASPLAPMAPLAVPRVVGKQVSISGTPVSLPSTLALRRQPGVAVASANDSHSSMPSTGTWEQFSSRHLVKVTNLSRRITSLQLQRLFTEQVGPVLRCELEPKGGATMAFGSQDHADEAVKKYNGGIIELTGASISGNKEESELIALFPNNKSQTCMEDRLGPLSKCGMVRGEGWVTLFRNSMASELKKHRGQGAVDWKGSFITISHLDEQPRPTAAS